MDDSPLLSRLNRDSSLQFRTQTSRASTSLLNRRSTPTSCLSHRGRSHISSLYTQFEASSTLRPHSFPSLPFLLAKQRGKIFTEHELHGIHALGQRPLQMQTQPKRYSQFSESSGRAVWSLQGSQRAFTCIKLLLSQLITVNVSLQGDHTNCLLPDITSRGHPSVDMPSRRVEPAVSNIAEVRCSSESLDLPLPPMLTPGAHSVTNWSCKSIELPVPPMMEKQSHSKRTGNRSTLCLPLPPVLACLNGDSELLHELDRPMFREQLFPCEAASLTSHPYKLPPLTVFGRLTRRFTSSLSPLPEIQYFLFSPSRIGNSARRCHPSNTSPHTCIISNYQADDPTSTLAQDDQSLLLDRLESLPHPDVHAFDGPLSEEAAGAQGLFAQADGFLPPLVASTQRPSEMCERPHQKIHELILLGDTAGKELPRNSCLFMGWEKQKLAPHDI
ncbi:hypothetical protein NMY22_g4024 [Coprinellus aureogranulatus]|nr:hypothetical protein NMY22_g4024 [Coprinellus aureogranulatus]